MSVPRWQDASGPRAGQRVAIGLSGGVDSAVAALQLLQRGCEVVAVTTRNFCHGDPRLPSTSLQKSCCGEESLSAARALSAQLGIPHTVLDVAEDFHTEIIQDFIHEYCSGRTPNPCIRCNERIRFPGLLDFARKMDLDWIATGHYARLLRDEDGKIFLARGRDPRKDQSYFLYRLDPELRKRICFPLGAMTKDEVRSKARAEGLVVADQGESQELCFVADGERSRLLENHSTAGEMVDAQGNVLGHHPGVGYFTIGQRKGLGLGGPKVHYVTGIDAAAKQVIVGSQEELFRDHLICEEVIFEGLPREGSILTAKTRYRHPGIEVRDLHLEKDRLHLKLMRPDRAPAPGQAVVLYCDDVVVGGGRLKECRMESQDNQGAGQ